MIRRTARRGVLALGILLAALVVTVPLQAAEGNSYTVTPLVSDVPGAAPVLDPNLQNAWGLAASSTSPWWVADNGTSLSTLYNGAGTPQALVVTVGTDSGPTGRRLQRRHRLHGHERDAVRRREVHLRRRGRRPARLETRPSTGRTLSSAAREIPGAIFKGLAIADNKLYAADFHNNEVAVFDSSVAASSTGSPTRACPTATRRSGSRRSAGTIFVTFAKQDADAKTRSPARAAASWTSSTRPGTSSRASPSTVSSTRRGGSRSHRPTSAGSAATCSSATSATVRSTLTSRARTAGGRTAASSGAGRSKDRDRRSLGARVRQRRQRRPDEHAVLHRGAERRGERPLRQDHGELTPQGVRERRPWRPVSRRIRLPGRHQQKGEL